MKSTVKPYQPVDNTITLEQTKESVINRLKSIAKMETTFHIKEQDYFALKEVLEKEIKNVSMESIQLIRNVYNFEYSTDITLKEAGMLGKHFLPELFAKYVPTANVIVVYKEDTLVEKILEIVNINKDEFKQKELIKQLLINNYSKEGR